MVSVGSRPNSLGVVGKPPSKELLIASVALRAIIPTQLIKAIGVALTDGIRLVRVVASPHIVIWVAAS